MTLAEALRVLGLPNRTTLREARSAYRRLAMKYHPDVSSSDTANKFIEIVAAYKFLEDYLRSRKATKPEPRTEGAVPSVPAGSQDSKPGLVLAPKDRWAARLAIYQRKFSDFTAEVNQCIQDLQTVFATESEDFSTRVFDAVERQINAYSDAATIRSRLHRDINRILHRESQNFLQKLTRRLRLAVMDFDNWLETMRALAREHQLPQTLADYVSRPSGILVTGGILAVLTTWCLGVASFMGSPLLWSIGLIVASAFISVFGGKGLYLWMARARVGETTQRFLAELELMNVDKGSIPVSKEAVAPENVEKGTFTGGMVGMMAGGGPIGILLGGLIGGVLGGLSGGKSFEQFRAEVTLDTIEALLPILDDFSNRVMWQIRSESQTILPRMQQNLIRNLQDEKLGYGLRDYSKDGLRGAGKKTHPRRAAWVGAAILVAGFSVIAFCLSNGPQVTNTTNHASVVHPGSTFRQVGSSTAKGEEFGRLAPPVEVAPTESEKPTTPVLPEGKIAISPSTENEAQEVRSHTPSVPTTREAAQAVGTVQAVGHGMIVFDFPQAIELKVGTEVTVLRNGERLASALVRRISGALAVANLRPADAVAEKGDLVILVDSRQ